MLVRKCFLIIFESRPIIGIEYRAFSRIFKLIVFFTLSFICPKIRVEIKQQKKVEITAFL